MSWLRQFLSRRQLYEDLSEEIRQHLEEKVDALMAAGMSRGQAERTARREFGNVTLLEERSREVWRWGWLERLGQDASYGVRLLRKDRAFTLAAILTLALGIGATTAIFSVVYGILLRPLPYPRPDRIVQLSELSVKGTSMRFTDPNFFDVRGQSRSLQGVAQFGAGLQPVSGGREATRMQVARVSRDFFSVMGVQPVLGRGFAAEDQRLGAAPAALVSDAFWRQFLGGRTDLDRVRLKVDDQAASVVGVLPAGFHFPEGAEIWMAREREERLPSRTAHNWQVVGRLRDGIALPQARAELTGIARRLERQYGQYTDMKDVAVLPLRDALTRKVRAAMLILQGAVGLLLLIACANVANLMLAQVTIRSGELAVRVALGAGPGRLLSQFLTEALLLAGTGGVLGVLAARWSVDLLVAWAPADLPRLSEVAVNLPVLWFALGVSVAVAAALGLVSAQRAASGEVQGSLVSAGRGQAGVPGGLALGRMIVTAQLALTLMLLIGAGLLGKSLLRVLAVSPGFRIEQVATMNLALPQIESDADGRRRVRFLDHLFDRLRGIPGVGEVGATSALPLTSGLADGAFLQLNPGEGAPRMEDLERLFQDATRTGYADFCVASEGYFRVLAIPLLRGRLFEAHDGMDAPHVAVISQALARARWPDRDPLGRTIEFGNMDGDLRPLTVVGIVGDVREDSLEAPPRPTVYVNYRQRPRQTSSVDVVLRVKTDPAGVLAVARSVVRGLDPGVPPSLSTFNRVFAASLQVRRFNLILIGVFAGTALLLALLGIYGVMGYVVARRTHEVGIRMALGARAGDVLILVLRQSLWAAAGGVAIGAVGATALTRTMRSLLFGVSATDPLTFAGVALLLAAAAFVASYLPARRATRVDPLVALRSE